jgi:hypothetical protein
MSPEEMGRLRTAADGIAHAGIGGWAAGDRPAMPTTTTSRRRVLCSILGGAVAVASAGGVDAAAREQGKRGRKPASRDTAADPTPTPAGSAQAADGARAGSAALDLPGADRAASASGGAAARHRHDRERQRERERNERRRPVRVSGSVTDPFGFPVLGLEIDVYVVEGGSMIYQRTLSTGSSNAFSTRLEAGRRYKFQPWDPFTFRTGPISRPVRLEERPEWVFLTFF